MDGLVFLMLCCVEGLVVQIFFEFVVCYQFVMLSDVDDGFVIEDDFEVLVVLYFFYQGFDVWDWEYQKWKVVGFDFEVDCIQGYWFYVFLF